MPNRVVIDTWSHPLNRACCRQCGFGCSRGFAGGRATLSQTGARRGYALRRSTRSRDVTRPKTASATWRVRALPRCRHHQLHAQYRQQRGNFSGHDTVGAARASSPGGAVAAYHSVRSVSSEPGQSFEPATGAALGRRAWPTHPSWPAVCSTDSWAGKQRPSPTSTCLYC